MVYVKLNTMPDTLSSADLRIAELEHSVRELRAELAAQRSALEQQRERSPLAFPHLLRELLDMTNSILPGQVRIESNPDPEHPGAVHIVFRVAPADKLPDANSVIDKEIEWHRNARRILPDATCHFSVAIDNDGE